MKNDFLELSYSDYTYVRYFVFVKFFYVLHFCIQVPHYNLRFRWHCDLSHLQIWGICYVGIRDSTDFNSLNAELNPICHLLVLLGTHHILHVSRIRFKVELFHLTVRLK